MPRNPGSEPPRLAVVGDLPGDFETSISDLLYPVVFPVLILRMHTYTHMCARL